MRSVAVTGVGGQLGGALTRHLDANENVARIVGVDRHRPVVNSHKFEFIQIDLSDEELADRLDGVDAVVHLAWELGPMAGTLDAPGGNLEAFDNVLRAVDKSGVQQVVFLSSATVYGAWSDNPIPIPEDYPVRPNREFPYAVQKAEAERLLADWADNHPSVAITVLRPALTVVGRHESALARALGGAHAIRERGSSQPVQFVHGDDVCDAIELVLERGLTGAFNVAPNGFIRDGRAAELAGVGFRPRLSERLTPVFNGFAWLLGRVEAAPAVSAYISQPWVVANDRLRAHGWTPRFSNEEALVEWEPSSRWGQLSAKRRRQVVLSGAAAAAAGAAGSLGAVLLRRLRRSGASNS